MKKIDLHTHTISVDDKDSSFEFDITKFQKFVDGLSIDAVAITNHNIFDLEQFKEMEETLQNVVIFPGIEIDFGNGHLLLIGKNDNLDDFNQKCELIRNEVRSGNQVTVEKLEKIFGDLNEYLLIPHYDKRPKVNQDVIDSLKDHIFAGEVQSPKKFNRIIKESDSLTPVLFSDARISTNLDIEEHQGNQTFIKTNADPLSINIIKAALRDKNKIFLSDTGKHGFFQVFSDGQELSNGLNIVLGERSSGKTFLLDRLKKAFDTEEKLVKYIEQFDLVKNDGKKFDEIVKKDKSAIREKYLQEFQVVVENVNGINRRATDLKLDKYIETLLEFASSEKLHDEFSKAVLFKENLYQVRNNKDLESLIQAVKFLLDNDIYKGTINKHITESSLNDLSADLEKQYKTELEEKLKKGWVNVLIKNIRKKLEYKTSSPKIEDSEVDFYRIKIEKESVKRFNTIANSIKQEKVISENTAFDKFKIRAIATKYNGAQELHDESGKQIKFSPAFKKYDSPIDFLEELKDIESLEKSELYKYFCRVIYQVLNKYDKKVSGGERAEFNLLKALQDARQYEMLLVDEPESSFDNLFLKDNVNKEIKEISAELPVVVVTHNSTVGMMMRPDYILYTQRRIIGDKDEYCIFSGPPGDKEFKTANGGETIDSYSTLLEALEAGEETYSARKILYDNFKK
jgi:predicted metal-dependent phosphoesterase TrpH